MKDENGGNYSDCLTGLDRIMHSKYMKVISHYTYTTNYSSNVANLIIQIIVLITKVRMVYIDSELPFHTLVQPSSFLKKRKRTQAYQSVHNIDCDNYSPPVHAQHDYPVRTIPDPESSDRIPGRSFAHGSRAAKSYMTQA